MTFCNMLSGCKNWDTYEQSVREGDIFTFVCDKDQANTKILRQFTIYSQLRNRDLEHGIDRLPGRNCNPLGLNKKRDSPRRLQRLVILAVEKTEGQCSPDIMIHDRRDSSRKIPLVGLVEVLGLHDIDFQRDSNHHLTAESRIVHPSIMSIKRHDVSGQLIRSIESKRNLALVVGPEERLECQCISEFRTDIRHGRRVAG